jgi:hypothetical protein
MSPVDEMQSSTVKSNAVSEQEKAEIGQGLMGDLNMSLRSSTTKVHLDRLQLFSLSSFWLLLCVAGSIFFYTTRINLECTVGGETVYGQKCTSSFILFGYPSVRVCRIIHCFDVYGILTRLSLSSSVHCGITLLNHS